MKTIFMVLILSTTAFADCDRSCDAWNGPSADAQVICHSNCAIAKAISDLAEVEKEKI